MLSALNSPKHLPALLEHADHLEDPARGSGAPARAGPAPGKSLSATSRPSTTTGRASSTSSAEKKRPEETARPLVSIDSAVAPWTMTLGWVSAMALEILFGPSQVSAEAVVTDGHALAHRPEVLQAEVRPALVLASSRCRPRLMPPGHL